ncbi:MAG: hypothetical protein ACI8S6_002926 [Myxococcota bacterium]|jgi:hypothetical protein
MPILDQHADRLRQHPDVRSVSLQDGQLTITTDGPVVAGFCREQGWLALVRPLASSPPAALRRQQLAQSETTGRLRCVLIDNDLWVRVDAQGPDDACAALDALCGRPAQPGPPAEPILAACRYDAQPAPTIGGWMLRDPELPEARALLARERAGEGTLAVYLAVQQRGKEEMAEGEIDRLLAMNDRLTLARLAPVAGLGLVAYAELPLRDGPQLTAALDAICADAAQAAAALSGPVDDPVAMLVLLRNWIGLRQVEGGLSDATIAAGVLASAAGTPLPAPLGEVPVMASVLGELAELLLETIPARARSGRLVMQLGLSTAAEGARPLSEIWEVAEDYLRSSG